MQEWCAPRILVEGTEAYSAVPKWSLTEAKNVFLDPDFVHLLRNPRDCLGDAQELGDVVALEKQWVEFTKYMLQLEGANVLKVRYEEFKCNTLRLSRAISLQLPIPALDCPVDDTY